MKTKLLKIILPFMLTPSLFLPPVLMATSCSKLEKIILTDDTTSVNAKVGSPLTGLSPIHAMTNKNKPVMDPVYQTDLSIIGCTFDSTTGMYHGIPQTAGNFDAHITASSPTFPNISSNEITLTIHVEEQEVTSFIVSCPHNFVGGKAQTFTDYQIVSKTNTGTVLNDATYSITTGQLPSGLSISSGGLIYGTPANSGEYSIELSVTSSSYPNITATKTITFNIDDDWLEIQALSSTYNWDVSQAISESQLSVKDHDSDTDVTDVNFSVDKNTPLPNGVTISSDGKITGIPTTKTDTTTVTINCTGKVNAVTLSAVSTNTSITVDLPTQLPLRYLQTDMDLQGRTINFPKAARKYPTAPVPGDYTVSEWLLLNGSQKSNRVGFGATYPPSTYPPFECVFSQNPAEPFSDHTQFYIDDQMPYWQMDDFVIPNDKAYIVTDMQALSLKSTFWDLATLDTTGM